MRLNIDPTEVHAQIEDYFEEYLSEADGEGLSTILALSSEVRSLYWEAASVHGLLEHTLQTTSVMVLSGRALSLAYLKRVWFSDGIHQSRESWLGRLLSLSGRCWGKALSRVKGSCRRA
jgi:hypothetical protein